MPNPLDLSRLQQFEPTSEGEGQGTSKSPQPTVPWPSREPVGDGQISIKAPLATISRFKHLCRDDRRTYADMLKILMDAFEGGQGA